MKDIMQQIIPDSDTALPPTPPAERRRHPRIAGPFRAHVRGVNAGGEGFVSHAELRDLSGGGLYMRLLESVKPGDTLVAEITLSGGAGAGRFTASCRVLRAERLIDGRYGAAVAFTNTRFLA